MVIFGRLATAQKMKLHHIVAVTTIALLANAGLAQELTLEDIWLNGTYQQKSVHGLRSMVDGLHYTTLDRTESGKVINRYAYDSGELQNEIISEAKLAEMTNREAFTINGYRFSPDEKQMLIATDQVHIYRHSTEENYYLVDLENESAKLIYDQGKQRHASFSPDGNLIAFVSGNDIKIYHPENEEVTPVTIDGKRNHIINGYADWVYEEEFSFDKAFEWSPDGSRIAYYRFDESEVREFNMQTFTDLYPEDYRYKYPKAGEKNAEVSIHVYDLKSGTNRLMEVGAFEYVPRIKWTPSSKHLAVFTMPRLQNELNIVLADAKNGTSERIYNESSKTYLEISDDFAFLPDDKGFIIKSEKDGFFHLYQYDMNGKNERQLTKGNWEVRHLIGFDEANDRVLFTASKDNPINTALYNMSLKGGEAKLMSPAEGKTNVKFSNNFKYYIQYHNTANGPLMVTLNSGDGTEIRELETNEDLRKKMESMKLSKVEFFDFQTSEGVELNGWMMKPTDFDAKKKYPVLMFVYGGPGSQTVTNSLSGNYWWHQYLTQQGYLVVSVDNRGTGGRGRDFRTQTYQQLGNLESKDQIEGARWLAKQTYVDSDRIGIWGWSYGGYMSSLCLFKGADIFKCAIAVAPVTNWRFYDSIYTERYMGLPQDNGDGYDDNSPINHVNKLEGALLLVHGTGDDNVHYQNSVEMVDALIEANKQFDYAIYPERNHGIYGGNTRLHLFTKMSDFVTENL